MLKTLEEIKDFILTTLDDKKASDIKLLDLEGKTPIARYMIFASGRSQRNISAIAEFIALELKNKSTLPRISIEGLNGSDWVLLDTGDIIVHLFIPEARDTYRLENYWGKT